VQKYDIRRPDAAGGGFEEKWWSPLNIPVLAANGTVRHLIHWVEDVTELIRLKRDMQHEQAALHEELRVRDDRIEAETFLRDEALEANRRLTESARRYRFLADAVPELIWTADPAGRVTYCNARWTVVTGLSPEEVEGDGWRAALHPEDRDQTLSAWTAAVRDATDRFQCEHRLRVTDGTYRWMLTTARPYHDDGGAILMWLGSSTDIHDRVAAEEQARQTHRLQAVGKLAGGMAHEVNNMMSIVIGMGELALRALEPHHPAAADVAEMVRAGERATAVTRQLLAFSRQQVLAPVVIDLGQVVRELAPALERVLGADRRLELVVGELGWRVVADRGQIEQALVNLVANARDATTTGGLVVVSIQAAELTEQEVGAGEGVPGPYVRVDVRDDGSGMTPEVLARVFEPFFTTKASDRGTGLGLSMVDGVVRQSGGFVRLVSAAGKGTTVGIYLPRADAPVTTEDAEAFAAPAGAGERVLVVDDEAALRSLACRVLEQHGYRVFQAPNGLAALNYVSANPGAVDLVLTDIVMPWMNGLELAAGLAERAPEIPVLFMSGYADDEILQRGALPAGTALVHKPATADVLALAVQDALDRARRAYPSTT
jgi:PAS domain S-box-containing protein